MTPRITVLGIGNIILRDEGFGVRVMEALRDSGDYGDDVQFLDGGTLGMELLMFLMDTKCLLILDAVRGEGEKGKLYYFSGEAVDSHFQEKLSAHELGIQDVLTLLRLTGKEIPQVTVIGAEPEDLSVGTELSPQLETLVPKAVEMARAELVKWNVGAEQVDEFGDNDYDE